MKPQLYRGVARGDDGMRLANIIAAMPTLETKYFGTMSYDESACFEFPAGLPAFELERAFLPIEAPGLSPIVFLQSVRDADLCFIALPVLVADAEYDLSISADDLELIGLPVDRKPAIGADVLVLALVSLATGAPATANLLAPLVISLATHRGVQAIREDMRYSHQYVLGHSPEAVPAC